MRVALGFTALLAACTFSPNGATGRDGGDDAPDGPRDVPDATAARVSAGLIALWQFDEAAGQQVAETSGFATPVTLTAASPVTWGGGTMTLASSNIVASNTGPNLATRITQRVLGQQGVTLEVWVDPGAGTIQGTVIAPAVVAGIDASVNSRDIAILQSGAQWLGRVRTNMTDPTWANGSPDLLPAPQVVVASGMTHVVLVADASTRALYVDGVKVAETTAGVPVAWDGTYRFVLGNELSLNRPWLGTYALVAFFDRALSPAEIQQNFAAGASAP